MRSGGGVGAGRWQGGKPRLRSTRVAETEDLEVPVAAAVDVRLVVDLAPPVCAQVVKQE